MDEKEQEVNEEVGSEEAAQTSESESLSEEQKQLSDERPEKNYRAELDRKNREIERLRQVAEETRHNTIQRRDPQDLTTWSEHELKAVVNSNDPSVLAYKDQAQDILLERKVHSIRERERVQEKRALSDIELRSKYPEALDPSSPFALKMEQVMYDYDLQKSPAGRLAAAKIVAAELGKGHSKAKALDRQNEDSRVRDVKAQMVDGDRSRPTQESPKKKEDLENRIRKGDAGAVGEALRQRGISRDSFFKK